MTKENNDNDNTKITDVVPQNEIDDLPTTESREDRFIRNLFICKTPYEAAIKAGYTVNTAKSTIYTKLKKERFKNKIRDYAITNDLLSLPKIAYIEEQILDHLVKNPLDTPKFVRTLKEKKQIAGMLRDKEPPTPPKTVTFEQINIALYDTPTKPEPIEDAEVIKDKTDTK